MRVLFYLKEDINKDSKERKGQAEDEPDSMGLISTVTGRLVETKR